LEASLEIFFCKKLLLQDPKKLKPDGPIQDKVGFVSKRAVLPMMMKNFRNVQI
jgi:hypothetical protein